MAVCSHLDQIKVDPPTSWEGCEDCLKIGGQSLEPREDWLWCFEGQVAFEMG